MEKSAAKLQSEADAFLMMRSRSSSTSAVRSSPSSSLGRHSMLPMQKLALAVGNGSSSVEQSPPAAVVKTARSESLPQQRDGITASTGSDMLVPAASRERSMSGGCLGGGGLAMSRGGSVSPRSKGVLLRKDLNASITSELSDTSERLSRKDSSLSNSFESSEGEGPYVPLSFDMLDSSMGSPKVVTTSSRAAAKHGFVANRPAARDLRLVTSRRARIDSDAVSSPDV